MTLKNRFTAMIAIAAVLAFAAPAAAQDTAPAGTTPDPLSASPPTTEPVPSTEPAPSTTKPIDPLSPAPAVEAAPAPAAPAASPPPRATRTPAPVRNAQRARPATRAPVAASPTPASPGALDAPVPVVAPIAATPPAEPLPAPVDVPEAAPVNSVSDDLLPLAATGGLALLALLGLAVALRRRKRRADEAAYDVWAEPAFVEPRVSAAFAEPKREPTMQRAPVAAATAPAEAPPANLPDGFDLSKFGPHVQAAYQGPTEDNPSLSLKNRLRRASALDQMERTEAETAPPAASARDTGAVVSKMRPAPTSNAFILGEPMRPLPRPRPVTHH